MARDSRTMRGDRPFVFTNLKRGDGLQNVIGWIQREVLYEVLAVDPLECSVLDRQGLHAEACECYDMVRRETERLLSHQH